MAQPSWWSGFPCMKLLSLFMLFGWTFILKSVLKCRLLPSMMKQQETTAKNLSRSVLGFEQSCWSIRGCLHQGEMKRRSKSISKRRSVLKRRGWMLVFVIYGFIKNVLPNSYFILQIYHVKSFKMMHVLSLYFNFSIRYS